MVQLSIAHYDYYTSYYAYANYTYYIYLPIIYLSNP